MLRRLLTRLLRLKPVGVDYCQLHHGIRNEDAEECDFRWHDWPDGGGGPRRCVLVALLAPPAVVSEEENCDA